MLARNPLSPPPNPTAFFEGPGHGPARTTLSDRLDAALAVIPAVAGVGVDPVVEALARPLGLPDADLACRRVRLHDGPSLTVVAASVALRHETARIDLFALKRAAARLGRRVLLVPAGALDRDPRLADAQAVAACREVAAAPGDRLAVMAALIEAGGTLPLSDAAGLMPRAEDPVAAVLGLVARRIVGLELRAPLGPDTRVLALPGRAGRPGGCR